MENIENILSMTNIHQPFLKISEIKEIAEEAERADLSGLPSHMLCGARCWDAAVGSRKDKPTLM